MMRWNSAPSITAIDPVDLESLTQREQEELGEVLEVYLADLEAGQPADREALLRRHPALADAIRVFLPNIEKLHLAGASVSASELSPEREQARIDSFQPTQLGDFLIKREIGRGGMGVVYAAEQLSLGRMVALKTLPLAALMNQQQVTRFKNEAQAAAGLHHPHIVPVYSVGCERGVHYFSMQLIEGQSLEQVVAQLKGEYPSTEQKDAAPARTTVAQHLSTAKSIRSREYTRSVAVLGKNAAEALHYAHENGVVHRDIKPSNLLLDPEGKVWVTDFGLARISDASNLTLTGDLLGTARYMSPEQASGRMHEVDHRSDVYSLGITLYELLTLQPAFDGESRQAILSRVASQTPTPPRQLNASIPIDLETILLKAIEPRREDRYRSAAAFAEDLQNFLEGRSLQAKRPGVSERLTRWASRHRTAVAASIAGLLLMQILVGGAATMLHLEKNKTQAEATRAETEASRAKAYLRETQRVVDNFGALVDERLEHLPGTSVLRAELLGELEQYYAAFVGEIADDPTLKLDLAKTQFRLAAVHQRLGDLEAASAGYRRALVAFEELQRESPHDMEHVSDVAICHNNLGQVAASLGDREQAETEYMSAIELYEQIAAVREGQVPSGHARTLMNLGLLLSTQKDPRATQTLERATEAMQELVDAAPLDLTLQDQLALCENNLASIVMTSDLVRAETLLRRSVGRYESMAKQRPASPEHRSDQALALGNLAAIVAHQGKAQESLELFLRVVQTRKSLVELEPEVGSHRIDLAAVQQQLGQVALSLGNADQAQAAYIDAKTSLLGVLKSDPNNARLLSDLGRNCSNLAAVQSSQGQTDDALASSLQAIDFQRRGLALAPERSAEQSLLQHYENQLTKLKSTKSASSLQPASTTEADDTP